MIAALEALRIMSPENVCRESEWMGIGDRFEAQPIGSIDPLVKYRNIYGLSPFLSQHLDFGTL